MNSSLFWWLPRMRASHLAPSLLILCLFGFFRCGEEDVTSAINVLLTDAPVDDDNIESANIVISAVEWRRGSVWEPIINIEKPFGFNLFESTQGKTHTLVGGRYVSPGERSALRLTLRLNKKGDPLKLNPSCNLGLVSGGVRDMYWYDNDSPTQVLIEQPIDILPRKYNGIVIDFDMRKSVTVNSDGDYILRPVVRMVNYTMAGSIFGTPETLPAGANKVIAYAYYSGEFDEARESQSAFAHAVTSSRLTAKKRFVLSYLEPALYHVVVVEHTANGGFSKVLDQSQNMEVAVSRSTEVGIEIVL